MSLATLFDSISIQSAPGHRPSGTGGGFPDDVENILGTRSLVNKKSKNGWIGTSSSKFIQDNQFTNIHAYDPVKGTPQTKMGNSVGNIGDLAITCPTNIGEIGSDAMNHVLQLINSEKGEVRGLTSREVRAGGAESKRLGKKYAPFERAAGRQQETQAILDYASEVGEDNKNKLIRSALSNGFTLEEANDAYKTMRQKEAEIALRKAENPSYQLYDIIDSKGGGGVDKREPGNNESAANLAMGGQGNPLVAPTATWVKVRGLVGRPRRGETKEEAKSRRKSTIQTNLETIQAEHENQNILDMMEEIKKESKGK